MINNEDRENNKAEIQQHSAFGSQTTQIGVQNNYTGISPESACNMAINLFHDNFPKLQEEARKIVEERIKELMDSVEKKLITRKVEDMTPFTNPDVQYAIFQAQKNYARFGAEERLNILSDLIVNRVENDNTDIILKVAIDKAIEIAPILNSGQLDFLSLLLLCTKLGFSEKGNVAILKMRIEKISETFSKADFSSVQYLNMLGCLQLALHNTVQFFSKIYDLKVEEVEKICPEIIKRTSGDYSTSHVGTVLAMINIKNKLGLEIDMRKFIH